jgi:hypothetical protein
MLHICPQLEFIVGVGGVFASGQSPLIAPCGVERVVGADSILREEADTHAHSGPVQAGCWKGGCVFRLLHRAAVRRMCASCVHCIASHSIA